MTPSERRVWENAAQHLWHANFELAEIAHLLGGISAERALDLIEAAEARQPKLCNGSCVGGWTLRAVQCFPMCPYCEHTWITHLEMVLQRRLRGIELDS